jgi:hypothetical protein
MSSQFGKFSGVSILLRRCTSDSKGRSVAAFVRHGYSRDSRKSVNDVVDEAEGNVLDRHFYLSV